jgi:hypothetical protein
MQHLEKLLLPKFLKYDHFQQAIARRKADGSNQWQDGYPNPEVILNDITKMLDMCY